MCPASSSVNSADDAVDLNIEDDDCILYGDPQNPLCKLCTRSHFGVNDYFHMIFEYFPQNVSGVENYPVLMLHICMVKVRS